MHPLRVRRFGAGWVESNWMQDGTDGKMKGRGPQVGIALVPVRCARKIQDGMAGKMCQVAIGWNCQKMESYARGCFQMVENEAGFLPLGGNTPADT